MGPLMSDGQHSVSFTALYGGHHTWLQRWLYRRLGCREAAADLAQDTFVRVLAKPALDEVKQPRAYLSTIARRLIFDRHRRRKLEQAYLESLAHLPAAHAPSEEQRWMILDTLQRLDRLLMQLKPRVRQVFLHAQLDDMSCPKIAEQLGVSRATVERDLAKAMGVCYRLRHARG